MSLRPCGTCSRPVRAADVACPFCEAALGAAPAKSFVRARLLGGAVAVAMTTGCPAAQPLYGVPTAPGGPSAMPSAPAPSASPSASPSPQG